MVKNFKAKPAKGQRGDEKMALQDSVRKGKMVVPSARREKQMKAKLMRQKVEDGTEMDTCGHAGLVQDDEGFMMPNKASAMILKQAREQREEEEAEGMEVDGESEVDLEYDDASSAASETPIDDHVDFEVDDEEAKLMAQFMPQSNVQSRNLADIIMSKIRNKEREADEAASRASRGSNASFLTRNFDPRIVKIYKTIGKVLKRYTTGKLPKAFKVLPNLEGWEELLWLTAPHEWSPHALYAATRLFTHSANDKMSQRFFNAILLPSVRSQYKHQGRLHSHTYAAIRKSMWKPGEFNKGFLLPFAAEDNLTLKEALIVSSVLGQSSMPRNHAMSAIYHMCKLPFNGASHLMLRSLLDKGYDMPYVVFDELVKQFHLFRQETRELPVLWHQCLLTFVQRYKEHLLEKQVFYIRDVINKHNHTLISSEIRRELMQLEQSWRKMGGCPGRQQQRPVMMS